jgi:hypothetical protein
MQPIPRRRKRKAPLTEEGGVQEEVKPAKKLAEDCGRPLQEETTEGGAQDA